MTFTSRPPTRSRAPGAVSIPTLLFVLASVLGTNAHASGPDLTLTQSRATGTVIHIVAGSPMPVPFERTLTDTSGGRDTIPARVQLDFAWDAQPVPPAISIARYIFESELPGAPFERDTLDASVHSRTIDLTLFGAPAAPGVGRVWIHAVDDLGGEQVVRRVFRMNFAPNEWFAGPDPESIPVVPGSGGQRYLTVSNWSALPPVAGSLLGCDSLVVRPAERVPRRTFFELYGDRLYLRADGDTVNMNSWILVHAGGYDPDSPYRPYREPSTLVDGAEACGLPATPRLLAGGDPNGSPSAFRMRVATETDPAGLGMIPTEGTPFPYYDWFSVSYQPEVGGWWPMLVSGRAYVTVHAEDGDRESGALPSFDEMRTIVQHIEQGTATPAEWAKRAKFMVVWVNRSASLDFFSAGAWPKPPASFGAPMATSPDRTLRLHLFASNPDPYDLSLLTRPIGGPTATNPLRWTIAVTGPAGDGSLARWQGAPIVGGSEFLQAVDLNQVAPQIAGDNVVVHVEVCDCTLCEQFPGSGRCVEQEIPVHLGSSLAGLITPDPRPLALRAFVPNPARGEAHLQLDLPDGAPASLEVFDLGGRRVWSASVRGAGSHDVRIDGALPPGVYLVRARHAGETRIARAAVVR